MLPSNNIQSIVGATLFGRDDEKIGRIDGVLVDAADGHPTWAVLHGGLFGRKTLYVPLGDARWERDDVFVDIDKETVKAAPHPDTEGGLDPAEEQALHAHYAGAPAVTGDAVTAADGDRDGDGDRDRDGVREGVERSTHQDHSDTADVPPLPPTVADDDPPKHAAGVAAPEAVDAPPPVLPEPSDHGRDPGRIVL